MIKKRARRNKLGSRFAVPAEFQSHKVQLPEPNLYDTVGDYLRTVRILYYNKYGRPYSQKGISDLLGLSSPQYISNIERSKSMPSAEIAVNLAEIYAIPRQTLYNFFMKYREREYQSKLLLQNAK